MLDGRYPSEEFGELRAAHRLGPRGGHDPRAQGRAPLAITNAGTIPDRGLFAVNLPDGRRVGELDEEMVYEARPGQTFLLGASTWRIEEIGRDRVIVTPGAGRARARCRSGAATAIGRPRELGEAIGAFARWAVDQRRRRCSSATTTSTSCAAKQPARLPARAAGRPRASCPSDRTIVIERFRDEIGDWRLCVLSPYGGRVHAAWGLALSARIRDEFGLESDAIWSDDGIIVHLPDADEPPGAELVLIDPDELEDLVVARARRLRAVRRALPRERRPRAAHPARLSRASARRSGSSG